MSSLDRMFGKLFAGRKGSRGTRRSPSRKQGRRLTMEHMETRVMMSANPIGNAAIPIHSHLLGPAIVAENLPGRLHIPAPAAPSLTASWRGGSQINLTWNSVYWATSYVVEEWTATGWKQIASLGGSATSYSVGGWNGIARLPL